MEERKAREISLRGALMIFGAILAIIVVGRLIFTFDVALLLMFIGMFTTFTYVYVYKFTWRDLFEGGVVPMIARASGAIMILLTVGPLIASWMLAGTIPYLIYTGLQILSPNTFLMAAFVICALSSTMTGTSWGTAATFGVAFMGIAQGLGVPLPAAAGAVVAGAYFGDKLSPVSDTTVLAAAVAEVDVVDHIRSMLWTTIPAFVISLGIYGYVGSQASGEIDLSSVNEIIAGISKTFKMTPLVLVPPLAVLVLAYRRFPTLPVLWIAVALAVPLAMMQGYDLKEIMRAMAAGPKIVTEVASLDKLLSRGGLAFMSGSVVVVFFAYIFAGQLEYTGTFRRICTSLKERFIGNSKGRFVLSASLSG
ncbi:MAG TPA: Na+/H+ antiporter NhaC family protein, partial [Synergistales bacterium]|nr:Na+/H+ antiporter NhaC family protein [Synergistales bacterium]